MAKFCVNCGTPYEEGAAFCQKCGNKLGGEPAAPKAAAPVKLDLDNIVKLTRQYMQFVLIGIGVLALIWGVLNLFGWYDVNATANIMGQSATSSVSLVDMYKDSGGFSFVGTVQTFNIICGILYVAAAGVCGWGVYEMFNKKGNGQKQFTYAAIGGGAAAVLHLFMYLFLAQQTQSAYGMTAKVAVVSPVFCWIYFIIFGGIVAYDWLVFKKK
jgi:predicted nucleic acid-binding Zn ribbon protein